jgi:hypothetical protein
MESSVAGRKTNIFFRLFFSRFGLKCVQACLSLTRLPLFAHERQCFRGCWAWVGQTGQETLRFEQTAVDHGRHWWVQYITKLALENAVTTLGR